MKGQRHLRSNEPTLGNLGVVIPFGTGHGIATAKSRCRFADSPPIGSAVANPMIEFDSSSTRPE